MKMTKTIAIENTNNYFQEIHDNKVRKAQGFCDTVADKGIEEASKAGNRQCDFYKVDLDIIYEACKILNAQGFTANIQGTTLFVKWY